MSVEKVTAKLSKESVLKKIKKELYSGTLTAPSEAGDCEITISAYDDSGNVSVAKKKLTVTRWHSPRTNWVSTDRFNFSDYNRIKNNLIYLHDLAVTMWEDFEILDMGEDIDKYTAYWDVGVFNLFEENLELINKNIFTKDFGVSQRFFENGPFIKWDELNRIEGAIYDMYILLTGQKKGLRKLAFRLGNKVVRI